MTLTFIKIGDVGPVRHRAATISLSHRFGAVTGFALQSLCGEATQVDEIALVGHEALEVDCAECAKARV